MRNPQGNALWQGENGIELERDTITCNHCNKVVVVSRKRVNIGFCRQCMDYTCEQCAALLNCTPWEKAMEKAEAADRFRRSV